MITAILWTKEAESTEMTDSTSVAMDTAVVAETQNYLV
jgi:hypothetical protein